MSHASHPVLPASGPAAPADTPDDTPTAGAPLPARLLLLLAAWTALWLGIAEAGLMAYARFGMHRYTHVNLQNVWMTPLWHLGVGLLLAATVLLLWRGSSHARSITVLFLPAWLGATGSLFLLGRLHRGAALLLAAGIGLQYARLVTSHSGLARRVVRLTLPLGALVVLGAFGTLNGGRYLSERSALKAQVPAATGRPNVLLIILDTVRAISLGLYGSERSTTPRLERFATGGVVFDRAWSVSSWTLPAHATMFTGQPPDRLSADWLAPLDATAPTLAERLSAEGYATAAFVANTFYASRESGLGRGFMHYEAYPIWSPGHFMMASSVARAIMGDARIRHALRLHEVPGRRTAAAIGGRFLKWQRTHDDRPFFAFLNYFDAHAPYLPPPPFDTLFGPKLAGRNPNMTEGRAWSPREMQAEIDAYDGAIAYLDAQLGALLDSLQERGVLDNTLIIITSDHGEEFGEHGVFGHGNSLYSEAVHVPLVIVAPGHVPASRRIDDWVSLRDLPATILEIATGESTLPGRSLARLWHPGTSGAEPDTLFAVVSHAGGRAADYPVSRGPVLSAMAEPFRLIVTADGTEELFDLSVDPLETHDLSNDPEAQQVSSRLHAFLRPRRQDH